MILGLVFIGIWLIAGLVMGAIVGGQTSPTAIDTSNNSNLDCEGACQQWEQRRGETCGAKRQTRDIQTSVDDTGRQLLAATLVHIGLVAAAVAAAFIPFIGQIVAIAIGAAAVAALGAVSMLTGKLAALSSSLDRAKQIERDAIQREEEARQNILKACPTDRANQCLNRPAPC